MPADIRDKTDATPGGESLTLREQIAKTEARLVDLRRQYAEAKRVELVNLEQKAANVDEERLSDRVRWLFRNPPFDFTPREVQQCLRLGNDELPALYKVMQRLRRSGFLEGDDYSEYQLSEMERRRIGWEDC